MIYLLQSIDDNMYIVMERTDNKEILFNRGDWSYDTPTNLENRGIDITSVERCEQGKPINWWLPKYSEFIDARLIVSCKTREGYTKWLNEHPEYLI